MTNPKKTDEEHRPQTTKRALAFRNG